MRPSSGDTGRDVSAVCCSFCSRYCSIFSISAALRNSSRSTARTMLTITSVMSRQKVKKKINTWRSNSSRAFSNVLASSNWLDCSTNMGRTTSEAHPSPVTHWNIVKKEIMKLPKKRGDFSANRLCPRIANTAVASRSTMKVLATGTIESAVARTIKRSAVRRLKTRTMRNARSTRSTLTPGMSSSGIAISEIITTTVSSQFHISPTKPCQ